MQSDIYVHINIDTHTCKVIIATVYATDKISVRTKHHDEIKEVINK